MTLQVFGVNPVIELAPVLLAVHRLYGGTQKVHHGGVAHLIDMGHLMQAQAGMTAGVVNREAPMPHGSGGADVATNAETQTLRMSVLRPDMRIILNVTEGLYRIVANACADEHRKRRRFVPFSPEIEVKEMSGRGSQEEAYHRREVAGSVRGAIGEPASLTG